jgi:hypothetical protein
MRNSRITTAAMIQKTFAQRGVADGSSAAALTPVWSSVFESEGGSVMRALLREGLSMIVSATVYE